MVGEGGLPREGSAVPSPCDSAERIEPKAKSDDDDINTSAAVDDNVGIDVVTEEEEDAALLTNAPTLVM